VLFNQQGWPFFTALPLAFVSAAAIGIVLERSLYRHLYTRSHLDQVLFSIGLTFMSVAAVDYIMGSSRVFINLPQALQGQFDVFGIGIGRYRLMIVVICGLLTIALQMVTVGGSSSITGPFLASLLLGIGDVAGKYYVPKMGPFVIYTMMIVILIWRPNGLFGRAAAR
jgi:branched-subunit amino acid ABC-type transport system permease component